MTNICLSFKISPSSHLSKIYISVLSVLGLFSFRWSQVHFLFICILEHDTAEDVSVKVFLSQNGDLTVLTTLKFTYISQMEHAIAKFLAQSASDPEIAEKMDAVWMICLGRDHQDLWDKRLAQAFVQLELPIEWTLVGDILQKGQFHKIGATRTRN